MKKKILAMLLTVVLLFSGCGGHTLAVNRIVGESTVYSETEIKSAMNVVTRKFRSGFRGCVLLELRYDEEKTLRETERREEQGETGEILVLSSKFYVGKSDGSLTPGMTYEGWTWELEKTVLGDWKLANYGFG